MKIKLIPNKQDIEKLSQLDRIEYKLDKKEIEVSPFSITSLIAWSFLLPIAIIFLLTYWFGSGIYYSTALNILAKLVKVGIQLGFIAIFIDITLLVLSSIQLDRLNNKYFKEGKWQKHSKFKKFKK